MGTRFDFKSDDATFTTPHTGIQGSRPGARQSDKRGVRVEPVVRPADRGPERRSTNSLDCHPTLTSSKARNCFSRREGLGHPRARLPARSPVLLCQDRAGSPENHLKGKTPAYRDGRTISVPCV
jgi:hypothetical protein